MYPTKKYSVYERDGIEHKIPNIFYIKKIPDKEMSISDFMDDFYFRDPQKDLFDEKISSLGQNINIIFIPMELGYALAIYSEENNRGAPLTLVIDDIEYNFQFISPISCKSYIIYEPIVLIEKKIKEKSGNLQ